MCSLLLVSIYNYQRTEIKPKHELQDREVGMDTLTLAALAAPPQRLCEQAGQEPPPSAPTPVLLPALGCLASRARSCTHAGRCDLEWCCCRGFPVPGGLAKPSECQAVQCCSTNASLLERGGVSRSLGSAGGCCQTRGNVLTGLFQCVSICTSAG